MVKKGYVMAGLAAVALIGGVSFAILYWRPSVEISRTYPKAPLTTSGMPAKEHLRTATKLLSVAVMEGRPDVVKWLLELGENANGIDPAIAPLRLAVSKEDVEMITILVAHGADPDLDIGEGRTILQFARAEGNQAITDALQPSAM